MSVRLVRRGQVSDEIARKLKAVMDDPMTTATARVYGSGSQYDMTLRYARRNVQNPMAPTLEATMEPQGEGTRITGTLGQTRSGRLFPFVWHGFLSLLPFPSRPSRPPLFC